MSDDTPSHVRVSHLYDELLLRSHIAHLYPASLRGGCEKRRLGVGGHTLVSGCPEHWTIQPQT